MRAGILGRADPCVGCQRRDRNVRNGREKEYDGVMEKSLCKRQNNERRKQCCVEANGSKDRPVSLKKTNQSAKSMRSLDFHKDSVVDFRDKGRMAYEKQGQEMEVTTIR